MCSVFELRGWSSDPNRNLPWRASANSRGRPEAQDRLRHGALSCGGKRQLPRGRPRRSESRLRGPVEVMTVDVEGLPPNTEFDFFVVQLPNAPFGLA